MGSFEGLVTELQHAQLALLRAFDAASAADHHVTGQDLGTLLGALSGVDRTAQAALVAATAQLVRREEVVDPEDCTKVVEKVHALGFVEELAGTTLAMTLGITTRSADSRAGRAARLVLRAPRMLRAVAAGAIEAAQAEIMLREVDEIASLDQCLAVDDYVADRLGSCDVTRLGQLARYAISRICPEALRTRAVANEAGRFVAVGPGPAGMAEVYATVPAVKAAAMWEATCELAKDYQRDDPSLTRDQARADAFVDLALTNVKVLARVDLGLPVVASAASVIGEAQRYSQPAPQHPDPTKAPGRTQVTSPTDVTSRTTLSSLAATRGDCEAWEARRDVDDDPWYQQHPQPDPVREHTPAGPLHLSGVHLPRVGYVPSDVVTGLVSEVGVQIGLALLDARTGALLGSTRSAYRPTAEMRHFVAIRDRRCRMFGCQLTAEHWDVDHVVAYPRGATSPANLAGLCRRHHRAKQRPRWRYYLRPDGVAVWQSPHGVTRVTYPESFLPPPSAAATSLGEDPEPSRRERRGPTGPLAKPARSTTSLPPPF